MTSFQPSNKEPPSVSTIPPIDKGFHRVRWVLTYAALSAVIAVIGILGYIIINYQVRLEANCAALKDIATATPQAPPGGNRPSQFQIKLIVDFHNGYIGQGCGKLPIGKSLQHWASYYSLSVSK